MTPTSTTARKEEPMTPYIYAGLNKPSQNRYIAYSQGDLSNLIVETVSNYFEIDKELLFTPIRKREIGFPRQICMYLMREKTKMIWSHIGNKFNRDHSTAMSSYDTINDLMQTDPVVRAGVNKIEQILFS